ncbi:MULTISPECIES: DUF998 domain-containing protein [Actinoalloteichus]|uniref:DUF998 domain-containing protein n=1 Tax=Actinoalloteichus TaxID=65496 RepID=UPI00036DABCB|nr:MULTISPECIES: DUF998 domain-containing protein [Actinoalloteichus]
MTALLWAGAGAAVAFVVVFLLDGLTRPGYRPVRHPVSALALGDRGWLQTTNFIVCGLLITAAAPALPAQLGSVPLAVVVGFFGLALVASGVFPMDPMRGYPPGTPEGTPTEVSRRHQLHDHAGAAVFTALPVASLVATFALPGPLWTWFSGAVTVALFGGFHAFGQAWENDSARLGLIQKLVITLGWSWLALLFVHAAT